jgi:hypothetical protein
MEEGAICVKAVFVADEESTEALEPGKGAFDFPTTLVAAQLPTILRRWSHASTTVRADQINPTGNQALA